MATRHICLGMAHVAWRIKELVGSPAFGTLCDMKGRRPFMLLGPIFGAVAVQFILLAPTIPLVLLSRFLQGLSTASSVPSTLSYLSSQTGDSEKLRGRVMSLFEVASIVGIAGGFATGGVIWDMLRHSAFAVVIAIYAVSGLLLWFVKDKQVCNGAASPVFGRWAQLLRSGSVVNAIIGLWFSHLDFQMGKIDDPRQLLVGGFSGKEIGLYTAGLSLLFVVGIGLWGLAFGRIRATRMMSIALGGLFVLVGLMLLLNHSPEEDPTRIVVLVGLIGAALMVVSGFTPAALAYLGGVAEERAQIRGVVMGLYSVFLGVGQLLGSGIGGFFAEWRGVDGMILLTAIFGCLSAVSVAALIRADRKRSTANDPQPPSAVC